MRNVSGGNELLNIPSLLDRTGMGTGMVIGDLGCGNAGYFVLQAARRVGENGKVYAVDILKPVLTSVRNATTQAGVRNVEPIWANLETLGSTKIPDNSVDIALLVNILFQSQKRADIVHEAARVMKSGGKLLIVDWKNIPTPLGPPAHFRVSIESLRTAASQYGLREIDSFDAGQFHFGLLFQKP